MSKTANQYLLSILETAEKGVRNYLSESLAAGRIERSRFVVTHSNKVHGGGFRYDGVFPGAPLLFGKVYSDDIICHLRTMPESEAAALVATGRKIK